MIHDGETYALQCGNGMQRVAWVARVSAQRLGLGGIWCTPDKEVGRPKEYIPGRVFYPDGDEIDSEATIASLVETAPTNDDADLTLVGLENPIAFQFSFSSISQCCAFSDDNIRWSSFSKSLHTHCLLWLRKEAKTLSFRPRTAKQPSVIW